MSTAETQLPGFVKAVFWFVVANAIGGALVLILFPAQTETFFFWKINPPINALLMGVMYLVAGTGVAYALLQGTWEALRYIVVMAFSFGGVLFIVTLLHRDLFLPGIRLYYWLLIYLVAVLFSAFIFWRFERAGGNWQAVHQEVRPLTRLSALTIGIVMLILTLTGLFLPNLLIEVWPWTISPLMLRVLMSWLAALAAGNLLVGFEKDWKRVRAVAYMLSAVSILIGLIVWMNQAELIGSPLILSVFSLLLVLMGLTGMFMLWHQGRSSTGSAILNQNRTF
jgi:hypothetical protein